MYLKTLTVLFVFLLTTHCICIQAQNNSRRADLSGGMQRNLRTELPDSMRRNRRAEIDGMRRNRRTETPDSTRRNRRTEAANGVYRNRRNALRDLISITGRAIDSESGEQMQGCTIMLMDADTTRLVKGAATDKEGNFVLKGIAEGEYVLKASFVGYHNFLHHISVKQNATSEHKAGTIMMIPNSVVLQQAVVTGVQEEMTVKEDTLIFNAAAVKVAEGSMLEELLKQHPGIEIDENGTIKVNGKTVKKILVEGKEFFSSDKNMAMKNLPANIIDKIKTYDKQSDLSRITGIDDGDEETVIDLGIKKGMKKGWFGNFDAAYGTHDRFSDKINVNRFTDKRQGSIIGSYNNINDQTGGRGASNNGITTSAMAGANIALDLNKVEIGGNVRYSHRNSNARTYNSSQNFVSTKASFSNSSNANHNRNGNINGDFKIEWKPDSLTTLLFRPSFSVGNSRSNSENNSATFNNDPYNDYITDPLAQYEEIDSSLKINHNTSDNSSRGSSYNFNGSILCNRQLGGSPWFGESAANGRNGRNVSLRISGAINGNENSNTSHSFVTYHQRGDSTDLTYRYRNTPSSSQNYSIGLTYSEPVTRNLFAQINYNFNHSSRHSEGSTYDFAKVDSIGFQLWNDYGQYGLLPPNYFEFLSDSLSRYTNNRNRTNSVELSLRYITQLLNVSAGIRWEHQNQRMDYQYQGLDTIASRNISRFSPTLNARLRFSKQHTLRITYRGNMQQPDMTDLFNLTDNTNPLNIRQGNPDLKPSFNNNLSADYNNYLTATKQTIFGRVGFSSTRNAITNRTEYNSVTGGQITRSENINGNWNVNGNLGFNTPLGYEKLTLNTNTTASWNNNVSYIYQNRTTLTNTVHNLRLGERLRLTLRQEIFDININGSINYSRSRSEMIETANMNTFNFSYGLSTNWNLECGLSFSTNLSMNSRRGYSAQTMNTNELIWNANVSYKFLRKRNLTVSLNAYDLLQQRSNISRSISAYSRRDTETNAINSFVMLHVIYRLNVFGSSQMRANMRGSRGNLQKPRSDSDEERIYMRESPTNMNETRTRGINRR